MYKNKQNKTQKKVLINKTNVPSREIETFISNLKSQKKISSKKLENQRWKKLISKEGGKKNAIRFLDKQGQASRGDRGSEPPHPASFFSQPSMTTCIKDRNERNGIRP